MSVYKGLDVLDTKQPNRKGPVDEAVTQKIERLDPGPGTVQYDAQGKPARARREFLWTAFGRAAAKVMADFLTARRGRAIPFWMPSYQQDFRLAAQLAGGGATATIDWIGYTEHIWPIGKGRRHIALLSPTFTLAFHQVTNATHTPGAATEALTISPVAGATYEAGTVGMFLKLCRLDTDEPTRSWRGGRGQSCEARIPVLELPLEEPA